MATITSGNPESHRHKNVAQLPQEKKGILKTCDSHNQNAGTLLLKKTDSKHGAGVTKWRGDWLFSEA